MKIRELQLALKRRGFDPGSVDGIRGPKTDAAIIAFKQSVGLAARSYVGPKTLAALGLPPESVQRYEQPWMNEAALHLGLKEIPGKRHSPTILRWTRALGGWWSDDETPWCGTFVAHCLRTAGIAVPKYWMRARSYSDWGVPVTDRVGAIAVFGRQGGGHVGFIVGESATNLYILGGNQRNEVNISPIAKSRLLAARWPADQPLGEQRLPKMAGGRRTTNEA